MTNDYFFEGTIIKNAIKKILLSLAFLKKFLYFCARNNNFSSLGTA